MSAPTPNQIIPHLKEEMSSGTGKLGRNYTARLTSGTENGSSLLDITIVHTLTTIDEVAIVEEYLPGARESYKACNGEHSDGSRPYQWTPKETGIQFTLCPAGGGVLIYEGPAELKKAVCRSLERACVLTIYIRLHSPTEETARHLFEALGSSSDYEIKAQKLSGSTSTEPMEGGLPFASSDGGVSHILIEIGDVVSYGVDGEESACAARVLSMSESGMLRVSGPIIGADSGGEEVSIDRVIGVHKIAGARGGANVDGPLKKLGTNGDVTWADLVEAIADCAERGMVEQGERGWPLNSDVAEAALSLPPER